MVRMKAYYKDPRVFVKYLIADTLAENKTKDWSDTMGSFSANFLDAFLRSDPNEIFAN